MKLMSYGFSVTSVRRWRTDPPPTCLPAGLETAAEAKTWVLGMAVPYVYANLQNLRRHPTFVARNLFFCSFTLNPHVVPNQSRWVALKVEGNSCLIKKTVTDLDSALSCFVSGVGTSRLLHKIRT